MSIQLHRKPGSAMAQIGSIRQHALVADGNIGEGGGDEGPGAHELYDAALAACKALTVMWYANKKGMPVTDVQTEVTSDNSQERQGTYRIHAKLKISGDVSDAQIAELAAVADKCPVHKLMTKVTTVIETQVERAA